MLAGAAWSLLHFTPGDRWHGIPDLVKGAGEMAFSPVKRVRERQFETTVQEDLDAVLRELADLPTAPPTPYLTVSLDWRPSGTEPEYRGAIQYFEQNARRIQEEYWPRGEVFDSLGADIEHIREWLTNGVDPASHGLFVVANSGQNVFEAVSVGLPLQNRVIAGPMPALSSLARLDEDNPTYAVLLSDQQQSYLSLISQATRVEELTMVSSDYPRKQATGGWSQRRFQQRADERLMALARQIAAETERYLTRNDVDMLIIAGDEVITGALDRTMPDQLAKLVIDRIRLDIDASGTEILEATLPIAERAEAEREKASVEAAANAVGQGDTGVAGAEQVIEALAHGRVSELILNEDYHEDGWANFANMRYGVGEQRDVLGGVVDEATLLPIVVEEEMVRLAIQQNAGIDIIHTGVPMTAERDDQLPDAGEIPRSVAARKLDELGGVAAILRY